MHESKQANELLGLVVRTSKKKKKQKSPTHENAR